jgi:hypothetical protein
MGAVGPLYIYNPLQVSYMQKHKRPEDELPGLQPIRQISSVVSRIELNELGQKMDRIAQLVPAEHRPEGAAAFAFYLSQMGLFTKLPGTQEHPHEMEAAFRERMGGNLRTHVRQINAWLKDASPKDHVTEGELVRMVCGEMKRR